MAGGSNQEFLKDPEAFLDKYDIRIPDAGEDQFFDAEYLNPVELDMVFDAKFKNDRPTFRLRQFRSVIDDPIGAYFLRFKEHQTTKLTLSDRADCFFTTELSGCRIEIGEGATPQVLHIAADFVDFAAKSKDKQKEADKQFGGQPHRKFSESMYEEADSTVLVGIRKKEGWKFYALGRGLTKKWGEHQRVFKKEV